MGSLECAVTQLSILIETCQLDNYDASATEAQLATKNILKKLLNRV